MNTTAEDGDAIVVGKDKDGNEVYRETHFVRAEEAIYIWNTQRRTLPASLFHA